MLALVGAACVPAYIASPVHAPLFTDEGEVSVAAYTGTTHMDVHGGVALTEHLALLIDASLTFSDSRYFFGGGGGYFTTLGDMWRFELYGGFAGGPTQGTEPVILLCAPGNPNCQNAVDYLTLRQGILIRPWAQATFGFSTEYFDVAWVNRFSFVQVKWEPDATRYDATSDGFFYEPVVFVRAGFKYIKAEAQWGLSLIMANTAGRVPSNLGWHVAFGLHFVWDFWGDDDVAPDGGSATGGGDQGTMAPSTESGAVGEVIDVIDDPVTTDSYGNPVDDSELPTDLDPGHDEPGHVHRGDAEAAGEAAASDGLAADEGGSDAVTTEAEAEGAGSDDAAAEELPLPQVTPPADGAQPDAEVDREPEADVGKKKGKKKKKKKKGKKKRRKKKKKKK